MSTISKQAYVAGIQDTLTQTGLANWPSEEKYAECLEKVSAHIELDPYENEIPVDYTLKVAKVILKLSEECMSEAKKDDKKSDKEKMEESLANLGEEEKEAAIQYLQLRDAAFKKSAAILKKHGQAVEGQEVQDNPGNSLAEAATNNSVAALEAQNRPEGFAGGMPADEPSAMLGQEQKAATFLANLYGKKQGMATEGQEVQANPGNSLAEAATNNSVAALEAQNRPADFAGGMPTDEPSAMLGREEKQAAFETLFRKTAEEVLQYMPEKLAQAQKINHIRAMMPLTDEEKVAYLQQLQAGYKQAN